MTGPGAALAEAYHRDVVRPLLLSRWPGLRYAAGRLGSGSDVLGYDDVMSRDHDWGLRLNVVLDAELVDDVRGHLEDGLPQEYAGRPVRFATSWDPHAHVGVQVDSPGELAVSRLGVDPRAGVDPVDWLSLTGQSVLEVTAGPVFTDPAGELTAVRDALTWYPDALWRYVLAADWTRLAQELPLAGRAGDRGDDLGSRVVMGRLVRTAMHLGFLVERRWPPYAKWLGTGFATLACGPGVGTWLARAMAAERWDERQAALAEAMDRLLLAQRDAGLPGPDAATQAFWARPYVDVAADVVPALRDGVMDDAVRRLPWGVGSVEQWVDSVDVLRSPGRRRAAARLLLTTDD